MNFFEGIQPFVLVVGYVWRSVDLCPSCRPVPPSRPVPRHVTTPGQCVARREKTNPATKEENRQQIPRATQYTAEHL